MKMNSNLIPTWFQRCHPHSLWQMCSLWCNQVFFLSRHFFIMRNVLLYYFPVPFLHSCFSIRLFFWGFFRYSFILCSERTGLHSHCLHLLTWRNTQLTICLWNLIQCLGKLWCVSPNPFYCYHVNYGKYYINSSRRRQIPVQRHDINLNYLISCFSFYPSYFHLIVSRGASGENKTKMHKHIQTHTHTHTHTHIHTHSSQRSELHLMFHVLCLQHSQEFFFLRL